jgi:hypothetical protein
MDTQAFPNFSSFLQSLSSYADSTGYRFRLADWQSGDEFVLVDRAGDVSASQRAIVMEYITRVKTGEEGLAEDLRRAAKISEQEGLRNVMVATCKELKLWPPSSEDRLQSIAYSDTSEPLDAIAWALYNHEQCIDETRESHDRLCHTASFLLDFAHAIGSETFSVGTSKAGTNLLTDFLTRATEWTQQDKVARSGLRDIIMKELGEFADPKLVATAEAWLDRHWEAVAVGTVALVAGMAIAAIALARNK